MGLSRIRHASVWCVGSALIALVFASSVFVQAQEDKNKEKDKNKTQAKSSGQPNKAAPSGRSGGRGEAGQSGTAHRGRSGDGQAGGTGGGQATHDDASRRGRSGEGQTGGTGGGQGDTSRRGRSGGGQAGAEHPSRTDTLHGTGAAHEGQTTTPSGAGRAGTLHRPSRDQADEALGGRTRDGSTVYRRTDGTIREMHTARGAVVVHTPGGAAFVRMERPGGQVTLANRAGYGYVARPLRGGTYLQRTYFVNGSRYVNIYRPYRWGGGYLEVYTPFRYYRPAFYSWLWDPWARPVSYDSWGWSGRPWYDYSSSYFFPYRSYAGPRYWLTDFMLAAIMEQAYLDRLDASGRPYPGNEYPPAREVGLTADARQEVADEVRRQLELERGQAGDASQLPMGASGDDLLPPSLAGPGPYVFVVSQGLDVTDVTRGRPCVVTGGDVLKMDRAPEPGASDADVVVLASRQQDCAARTVVSVPLPALVEMQNRMRETLDQGLQRLQSQQGRDGLPALSTEAAAPPVDASYAREARADPDVADALRAASQEASRAEQEAAGQTADPTGARPTPARITLGQTVADVQAAMGAPLQIVDLGSKRIYVYRYLKITFVDGKVTDVQ